MRTKITFGQSKVTKKTIEQRKNKVTQFINFINTFYLRGFSLVLVIIPYARIYFIRQQIQFVCWVTAMIPINRLLGV